jgi:hypothetical protein
MLGEADTPWLSTRLPHAEEALRQAALSHQACIILRDNQEEYRDSTLGIWPQTVRINEKMGRTL